MPTAGTDEGLKRVIGVPGLTLSIVNGIIGAGIFVLPAVVSISLGAFGIFAYVACGILLAAIMLCYAEIGSRITTSGGSYAYVEAAFGELPSYLVNWLYFFAFSILSDAALLNVVADSLSVLFPAFLNQVVRGFLFFGLIGLMALVNILGVKQGIRWIQFISIIKLLPLLGIIVFGFSYIDRSNLHWQHLPSLPSFGNTLLVLFFAFGGFETSLGASGEFKNPQRTVHRGILFGGAIVLVVYLFLQVIAQGVLGGQMNLYKDAPLAAVAEKIVGPIGATILLVAAMISCFGNVIADILATPRSLFAGAKDGLFPKFLGKVHVKFATPYLAIITHAAAIFIFSISGGFKQLAVLASAALLLVYFAVVLSTVKLRMKKQAQKTFKAPGGLFTPFLALLTIGWLFTSLSKWELISTALFIGCVCVLYFITKWVRSKQKATIELATTPDAVLHEETV